MAQKVAAIKSVFGRCDANALETFILYQHLQGGHSTAPVSSFKTLLQIPKHFFILHSTAASRTLSYSLKSLFKIWKHSMFAECWVVDELLCMTKRKACLMITEHWLTARTTIDKWTTGQWPILMYRTSLKEDTELFQMVEISSNIFSFAESNQ